MMLLFASIGIETCIFGFVFVVYLFIKKEFADNKQSDVECRTVFSEQREFNKHTENRLHLIESAMSRVIHQLKRGR